MYSSANWIPAVVLWMQPWPLFMVIARLGCLYPSKWDWVQLDRSSLNQLDCRGSIDVRLDRTELPELAEANLLRILVWTPSPLSSQFTGHILTPTRNLNWIPFIPAKSQYTHPPTSEPPMGFHGSLLSWDKLIYMGKKSVEQRNQFNILGTSLAPPLWGGFEQYRRREDLKSPWSEYESCKNMPYWPFCHFHILPSMFLWPRVGCIKTKSFSPYLDNEKKCCHFLAMKTAARSH